LATADASTTVSNCSVEDRIYTYLKVTQRQQGLEKAMAGIKLVKLVEMRVFQT
tara:strand:- start:699 stop:857 length:159 start_codon:yes stop_codon:yes gene_type:complete